MVELVKRRLTDHDEDELERLEGDADDWYSSAVPSDGFIAAAFAARLRSDPGLFNPAEPVDG